MESQLIVLKHDDFLVILDDGHVNIKGRKVSDKQLPSIPSLQIFSKSKMNSIFKNYPIIHTWMWVYDTVKFYQFFGLLSTIVTAIKLHLAHTDAISHHRQ